MGPDPFAPKALCPHSPLSPEHSAPAALRVGQGFGSRGFKPQSTTADTLAQGGVPP
jgi:hypothetical protein